MAVRQRKELEASPLADLHAIASELGLEGFRTMRKADLIGAILGAQGGESDAASTASDEREPDEVPSDETLEGPPGTAEPPPDDADEDSSDDTSEDSSEDTSEAPRRTPARKPRTRSSRS